jgi:hypothetical protein
VTLVNTEVRGSQLAVLMHLEQLNEGLVGLLSRFRVPTQQLQLMGRDGFASRSVYEATVAQLRRAALSVRQWLPRRPGFRLHCPAIGRAAAWAPYGPNHQRGGPRGPFHPTIHPTNRTDQRVLSGLGGHGVRQKRTSAHCMDCADTSRSTFNPMVRGRFPGSPRSFRQGPDPREVLTLPSGETGGWPHAR